MKSIYKWGAVAFGVSLVSTIVYGQARTPFTRPAYVTTPGPITSSGAITGDTLTATTTSTDAIYLNSGRPICMNAPTCNASSRLFYNGSAIQAGGSLVASVMNSTVVSGGQAFACSNVGCRLSLGNTGRYLVDDGTNLEFVAPVQATSFEATNTTANAALFSGGSATNAMYFQSNTTDAFTGSATGYDSAFVFKVNENVADSDIVFSVLAQNNTIPLYLQENGNLNARGNINVGQFGEFSSAAAVPIVIAGRQADGASSVGVVLRTNSNLTTSGAKIVSVRNNVSTEVASIDKDGLLRVNAANAAKPTCNATNRGRIYYSDGAAGVADTFEVCGKDAADVYAWKAIVTF